MGLSVVVSVSVCVSTLFDLFSLFLVTVNEGIMTTVCFITRGGVCNDGGSCVMYAGVCILCDICIVIKQITLNDHEFITGMKSVVHAHH